MDEEISITVKSPTWNKEEREKWLKFRTWVEAHGGKLTEGMGMHIITFKPVEPNTLRLHIG